MAQKQEPSHADFTAMLTSLGLRCVNVKGVYWYEYNSFLRPAYLPHNCPPITSACASHAIEIAGVPFARWETELASSAPDLWWLVNRYPPYNMDTLSGNTRSKIRRGRKRYHGRLITPSEIQKDCLSVCKKAVTRFGDLAFLPTRDELDALARTAHEYPGSFEVFGVFSNDRLVGFSQNHLDGDAVLIDKLWYDPEFLPSYSSYVLVDALLSFYLEERRMKYVSDGSRNLYHDTNVHDFLIQKFGFKKVGMKLNIVYAKWFSVAIHGIFPFRRIFGSLAKRYRSRTLRKIDGILRQEKIRRSQE